MGNSASLSSLPYTIGDEIEDTTRQGSYGWSIHTGKRKSDGLPVCVFKGNKPKLVQSPVSKYFPSGGKSINIGPKNDRVDPNCFLIPAFRHFQKSKTLVHPNLLKVYATLDTDAPVDVAPASGGVPSSPYANTGTGGDLVIVTEEVTPLLKWIQQQQQQRSSSSRQSNLGDQLAWGLVGIIQALSFLHSSAKMSHCSLSPESIYVTPGGDFKLGNFSLLQQIGGNSSSNTVTSNGGIDNYTTDDEYYFKTYEAYLCPTSYRCPERVNGDYTSLLHTFPSHVIDSYSLGQLIEDLYSDYTNLGIPEKLVKAVSRLKTLKTQQRPRVAPLLRCPALDTPHIKAMEFLSDIDVKPAEEKILFLQSIPDQLSRNVLSPDALKYKLLSSMERTLQNIAGTPTAIGQDINRREVMGIIPVIFIISDELNDDEFKTHISPLVSVLFQLNDRGVRATLLQRLDTITSRLDKNSINSTVFEPMCTGFTDSSGALRELTLKSTIPLIPNLSSVNLEKLGRYLVRLQSDPENSIRTNTVIFISKIAPSLSKISREKLLLPAFIRAMKDPFYPCRIAALKSILQCKEFFSPKALAEQVVPCIAPHLIDPAEKVRSDAFHVMDEFMSILRNESERLSQSGDPNALENNTGVVGEHQSNNNNSNNTATSISVAPTSSGSSGSYLSGFTSYMWSSSTKPTTNTDDNKTPTNVGEMTESTTTNMQQQPQQGLSTVPVTGNTGMNTTTFKNDSTNDTSGWSDDDEEEEDIMNTSFNKLGVGATTPSFAMGASLSITSSSTKAQESTKKKNFLDTSNPEDFFSSSMLGTRGTSSSSSKSGFIGGVNRANLTTSVGGTTTSRLVMPTSAGNSSSTPTAGSSMKSKTSLAERKAEFARRKAEREAKQQQQQKASKLEEQLTDGWDDF